MSSVPPDAHQAHPLLDCCAQARVRDLEATGALAPRDRSTILWSYGKLRCYPGEALTNQLLAGPATETQLYEPVVSRQRSALHPHDGVFRRCMQMLS